MPECRIHSWPPVFECHCDDPNCGVRLLAKIRRHRGEMIAVNWSGGAMPLEIVHDLALVARGEESLGAWPRVIAGRTSAPGVPSSLTLVSTPRG